MNLFEFAEREEVDVEAVFRFAYCNFGFSTDNNPEFDYALYERGGRLPHYVNDLLEYQDRKRTRHLH